MRHALEDIEMSETKNNSSILTGGKNIQFTYDISNIAKWRPKTPIDIQSKWFLQSALPLKPKNKQGKRPVSQVQSPEQARPKPQKSTSSASKAEEQKWISKAREYVNMAHLNNPVYSGILQAIDAVLDRKSGE